MLRELNDRYGFGFIRLSDIDLKSSHSTSMDTALVSVSYKAARGLLLDLPMYVHPLSVWHSLVPTHRGIRLPVRHVGTLIIIRTEHAWSRILSENTYAAIRHAVT
ncbi:hypothetical protein EVAR_98552_1 [Eumeta japonica]|uniref:Uncharacterized protein n=1 Tax=Eumeta variegata TaxID=151549 RepID=A0A4C1YLF6_EUMVA|nr:hypothetical protein EVAR_98552_1 [Eumeta japonica]